MAGQGSLSFAEKPVLTGRLVTLRPVLAEDAAGLFAMDDETGRLTGSPKKEDDPNWTLENLQRWYASRAEHDDRIDLSIIERATGAWAGEVVLNELNVGNESCGFRIALQGPRFYGRGLGTEATRLIIGYAFATVGVHRIELQVYDFNPRARHVYERVGFVHEGTMREALRGDGQWIDCHLMGMLASDWDRLHAGEDQHHEQ
jgi:RimJ/RimL family protein N-acetyltransferase